VTKIAHKLGFYATPPHDCSYLTGKQAITLFADPHFPKSRRLYSALLDNGFRRSGEHLYQPYCSDCSACIPIRIPVNRFKPTRNQVRTWRRNQDLVIRPLAAEFDQQHFELYQRYLASRHAGGGMDNPTPENYMDFLTASWADTAFYEMKLGDQLLAVAAVDHTDNALSSVYTFFDPDFPNRSLGKYAILFSIDTATKTSLSWLYLGYWIADCRKMNYKNEFRPVEFFINDQWRTEIDEKGSRFAR
jgi:arginine-tRNA-protein transferase